MAKRMKTSEKVAMLSKSVELIETTKASNKVCVSEFKEIVDKAKFVPVDNLYKVVISMLNEFEELLSKDSEAFTTIAETICKDPVVDESSRSGAKRVINSCTPLLKTVVHESIDVERNGEEDYDDSTTEQITELIKKIGANRKNFILAYAQEAKKVEDPSFTESLRIVGKNNEAFCNSMVRANNAIKAELEALDIHINKKDLDVSDAVGVTSGKTEVTTKAYKAVPEL